MSSASSTPTTPLLLTPDTTGSTGSMGSAGSTGSTGSAGSAGHFLSPDDASSSDTISTSTGTGTTPKKSQRRQTAFYPHVNSSNKTQKPFSRSAAKRESVMALGSIEHLQYYFTKAGLKAKKKPLDKAHYGLVPAIGSNSNIHSPGTSSITSISELQLLPPTPVVPDTSRGRLDALLSTPHVKAAEIDPETLLPGVIEDLRAVERVWCIDGLDIDDTPEDDKPKLNTPIDILDILQTTTRAIRSTRNYLLAQPLPDDTSATGANNFLTAREHFRSNRLGPQPMAQRSTSGSGSGSSGSGSGRGHDASPDGLTLIRRSALEVLGVLRELEEKTRLPLSDEAYDAQSDGGISRKGAGAGTRGDNDEDEDRSDVNADAVDVPVHQVDHSTSVAFSLIQVNGRYESVPVWEDPDGDDPFAFNEAEATKEAKERWDERLVLGSGWLYAQDVTLEQVGAERRMVGGYLDLVDGVLFEGTKPQRTKEKENENANGEGGWERGWERERRRRRERERERERSRSRNRNSAKRRVSAGDVLESRTSSMPRSGVGLGLGLGPVSGAGETGSGRRVSTGMLPDLMNQLSLSEEPQQMEGISEEAEHDEQRPQLDEGDNDDDSEIEDDALPEWAKRSTFVDHDLDRAHSLLLSLLPPHMHHALLPPSSTPPSSSPSAHALFLQSLSSGQLLCIAYNAGVRKSKKPWGYINKEGIHDILALQSQSTQSTQGTQTGWTFRRSDNLRLWVGALKLRYMLPIVVPSQTLSSPPNPSPTHNTTSNSNSNSNSPSTTAHNTPLSSPHPSISTSNQKLPKFPTNEPPVTFDARIVAKQEDGWEEMLEAVLRRWMWRVVDEKRSEK
ncbi:hypothetical protein F5878DRAFT_723485 [Lentinula raphanica]|uniref:Uncharacterized protein n=1 Tax=Lentinula raphanica TaxID=153919 RepID=A0AA38PDS2_9AGAR|nr:hypothetical protein F5878DRAFT_723485 [Lentinula raphanica]